MSASFIFWYDVKEPLAQNIYPCFDHVGPVSPAKSRHVLVAGFFVIFGGFHPLTPVGIRPNCLQIFHWNLDDLWWSRFFRGIYPVGWAVESEIVIQRYNLDFFDKLARRADSYRVTVGPLGGAASGRLGPAQSDGLVAVVFFFNLLLLLLLMLILLVFVVVVVAIVVELVFLAVYRPIIVAST